MWAGVSAVPAQMWEESARGFVPSGILRVSVRSSHIASGGSEVFVAVSTARMKLPYGSSYLVDTA
jgi:hypothetical protein